MFRLWAVRCLPVRPKLCSSLLRLLLLDLELKQSRLISWWVSGTSAFDYIYIYMIAALLDLIWSLQYPIQSVPITWGNMISVAWSEYGIQHESCATFLLDWSPQLLYESRDSLENTWDIGVLSINMFEYLERSQTELCAGHLRDKSLQPEPIDCLILLGLRLIWLIADSSRGIGLKLCMDDLGLETSVSVDLILWNF